jgi:hypothetical protein
MQSDWAIVADATPKPSKEAWLNYRQALRDITKIFAKPEDVIWPESPKLVDGVWVREIVMTAEEVQQKELKRLEEIKQKELQAEQERIKIEQERIRAEEEILRKQEEEKRIIEEEKQRQIKEQHERQSAIEFAKQQERLKRENKVREILSELNNIDIELNN